ncbi:MAG: hypothetical protein KTR15_00245 [Phycisphaeraceae bacterium]|nr:hypothetical protein [Phycisphaeraceae bacterium]
MPQTPCPYCGHPHDSSDVGRCSSCNGLFEPLSQIATQLAMGPWYVRDEDRPFMPGFNEAILRQQVATGRITANTILRGPTTNQFWANAADTPGVSRLMGTCHSCHQAVEPTDTTCQFCKADLSLPDDVDALGLRYTTDEQRTQAQKDVAQARTKPVSKPTNKPTPRPEGGPVIKGSTVVSPDQLKPVKPTAPAPEAEQAAPQGEERHETYDGGNDLASELAEDVWHAGPAPSRRRRKKKGADPLVIGMGVVLLCVVALGGFILLTSGTRAEDDKQDEQVEAPATERDSVAVSQISVPALAVYERLVPEDIPAEFEDRYKKIRRLALQAEADKKAERFNEAFDAYKELGELVAPLESDIAQWQANELAKQEINELRERVSRLQQQAKQAEAARWAAKQWLEAQATWEAADKLFTSASYVEAGEIFVEAEAAYLAAENKAGAGQAANRARGALNEAMQASGSQETLRKFANEQIDTMLRLRGEADGQFNDQQYAQAEQSYNNALDALNDAKQIVEMARYRKYYAFEAGYQASALMLSAARGDGVDATAQSALKALFDKLRILPNPAAGITPGDDVGFTIAINPLVNDARDAIIKQHGEAVQACYLIGFHASIIDQTLKTIALTDDQQKRIHQSLGTIEEQARKAGWDLNQLRPLIEQVRIANRKAKLKNAPEATRAAWKRMLNPMQSRSQAPQLMDPSSKPGDIADPELFPTRG